MTERPPRGALWRWWPLLLLLLLPLPWLLPLPATGVQLQPPIEDSAGPELTLQPAQPTPGEEVTATVRDHSPWAHVRLAVNGQPTEYHGNTAEPEGSWSWRFTFTAPQQIQALAFYHSCHEGCLQRGWWPRAAGQRPTAATTPTKLCTVFPDPARDWHGRSGWAVELTYAQLADDPFWGVDDLAGRVHEARMQGLRVLVRVDYDQGQSVPPTGDFVALDGLLDYVERLARDERLSGVYGYFIGSGFNTVGANQQSGEPVTAEWYARLFNGHGEPPDHEDNLVQRVRAINPQLRLLVGPVRPWVLDQSGERPYTIDVPWLSYMNTLVALLDETARHKAANGFPLAAPDGFALHVPGNPAAPELGESAPFEEPALDLPRGEWAGAQAGFGLYREWLAIINQYESTRGLPAFITATNTFVEEQGVVPAQGYPSGWLTTALGVVNAEPQIESLCWFVDKDRSGDGRWANFSLSSGGGKLIDAAEEFDGLLRGE